MKHFHRSIFFTKVPLGGFFTYKDVFQIFPAEHLENIPTTSHTHHYPNILEYWITETDAIPLHDDLAEFEELLGSLAGAITKQDKILELLSVFSNNLFFRYKDLSGNWGMPLIIDKPGKEANEWSSFWCLPLFHFPDLSKQLKINEFSIPNYPPISTLRHNQFFVMYPNLDYDRKESIIFPDSLIRLLDAYFSLEAEIKPFVDAAISYTVSAIELKDNKKTLSLLASFTSMETMVNLEYRSMDVLRCETCGQDQYKISRKFRDYLLKYIGHSQNNKKKFNTYYSLRSKIVHTGEQLKTELLFANVDEDQQHLEMITKTEILQINKLAIANWLLTKFAIKSSNHF